MKYPTYYIVVGKGVYPGAIPGVHEELEAIPATVAGVEAEAEYGACCAAGPAYMALAAGHAGLLALPGVVCYSVFHGEVPTGLLPAVPGAPYGPERAGW